MRSTTVLVMCICQKLYAVELVQREIVFDIAGVERRSGLEQQNPAFFFGDGTMLHSTRNHDEFALLDPFMAVAKLHPKAAFDHQEHLIFIFVMMKDEFAFGFDQFDVLSVELSGDMGLPVLVN